LNDANASQKFLKTSLPPLCSAPRVQDETHSSALDDPDDTTCAALQPQKIALAHSIAARRHFVVALALSRADELQARAVSRIYRCRSATGEAGRLQRLVSRVE